MLNLKVCERLNVGKGAASTIRADDKVPGIIYGNGKPNMMFAISEKDITQQFNKPGYMSHLFTLELGNDKYMAIPKAVQLHPVTDRIMHVDFMHIGKNDDLKVLIQIIFVNKLKSIGIKQGGIFTPLKHELEVSCNVNSIPESIEIDLAELGIGQSIHVGDIKFPEGVKPVFNAKVTVATITGRASQKEAEDGIDSTEEKEEADK